MEDKIKPGGVDLLYIYPAQSAGLNYDLLGGKYEWSVESGSTETFRRVM